MSIFANDFMRNAFLAGTFVAVTAGLVGYFVLLRNQVFIGDALGHAAFTSGLGALLLGTPLLAGVFGGTIATALGMNALGGRARGRDVAVGTVFAWVLGLGVLFLSIYTAAKSGSSFGTAGISILFGSILGLDEAQVLVAVLVGVGVSVALVLVARPLLFLSVDPDAAAARGVPVRLLGVAFTVLVAATVAESVQAVGALLIFALLVTPPAIAQRLSARPYFGLALSAALAVAFVWAGLVLAFYFPYPASFFITATAFAAYVACETTQGLRERTGLRSNPALSNEMGETI